MPIEKKTEVLHIRMQPSLKKKIEKRALKSSKKLGIKVTNTDVVEMALYVYLEERK